MSTRDGRAGFGLGVIAHGCFWAWVGLDVTLDDIV